MARREASVLGQVRDNGKGLKKLFSFLSLLSFGLKYIVGVFVPKDIQLFFLCEKRNIIYLVIATVAVAVVAAAAAVGKQIRRSSQI